MSAATVETWERFEWGDHPCLYRREGDTLTFRATSRAGHGYDVWVPLVPVAVEIGDKAAEAWAYLDSGTTRTYVPRSTVEAAGVSFEELEDPRTLHGEAAMSSRYCPGRILLADRRPLLEDGFLVPEAEPSPVHWAYGAAFILGLDVFDGFRVTFDWTTDTDRALLEDPPTFTLTPRAVGQARSGLSSAG